LIWGVNDFTLPELLENQSAGLLVGPGDVDDLMTARRGRQGRLGGGGLSLALSSLATVFL
jgi:hypothetical protein